MADSQKPLPSSDLARMDELEKPFAWKCLPQGIDSVLIYRFSELTERANVELDFWANFPRDDINYFTLGTTHTLTSPRQAYIDHWREVVRGLNRLEVDSLIQVFKDAQNLRFILSKGLVAEEVKKQLQLELAQGYILALAASSALQISIEERLQADLRTISSAASFHAASHHLASETVDALLKKAGEACSSALRLKEEMDVQLAQSKADLASLKKFYTNEAALAEPSSFWGKKSFWATFRANIWLGWFIILVIGPIIALGIYWDTVQLLLRDVLADNNGISITSLALVSAPILGYGWVLKHISRNYIHNQHIASDASYRKIMCMTFLTLSKQESANIGEAERALILNALFRQAAPNSSDDGPPSGILELIRK